MRWLREATADEVLGALVALDERFRLPVTIRAKPGGADPQWRLTTARLGDRYVVKFPWSMQAADRLSHEINIVRDLQAAGLVQRLPEVVLAHDDPVLLVTRYVPGTSLFEAAGTVDLRVAGTELGEYLAGLHSAPVAARLGCVEDSVGYPAATAQLRAELPGFVNGELHGSIETWCRWIDRVLAQPGSVVVVHGDLNGDNQIWRDGHLHTVLDYETVALAEPEYDFRVLPGIGAGTLLLDATTDAYQRQTGRALSAERIMAWHVRTALGDILWRSRAGVALPDRRTPRQWFTDLSDRTAQWLG